MIPNQCPINIHHLKNGFRMFGTSSVTPSMQRKMKPKKWRLVMMYSIGNNQQAISINRASRKNPNFLYLFINGV